VGEKCTGRKPASRSALSTSNPTRPDSGGRNLVTKGQSYVTAGGDDDDDDYDDEVEKELEGGRDNSVK
jgi:hypothetical protein